MRVSARKWDSLFRLQRCNLPTTIGYSLQRCYAEPRYSNVANAEMQSLIPSNLHWSSRYDVAFPNLVLSEIHLLSACLLSSDSIFLVDGSNRKPAVWTVASVSLKKKKVSLKLEDVNHLVAAPPPSLWSFDTSENQLILLILRRLRTETDWVSIRMVFNKSRISHLELSRHFRCPHLFYAAPLEACTSAPEMPSEGMITVTNLLLSLESEPLNNRQDNGPPPKSNEDL